MAASNAQIKATRRYESSHYDIVTVRLPKGTKETIQATGTSVNAYIVNAVIEKLNK